MSEYGELKPGHFYWVKPEFDVDCVPDGFDKNDPNIPFQAKWEHWTQNTQPARFEGFTDGGQEKWIFLGQDVDPENWWPVCWIGAEITMSAT